jgi:hypothetical protein
MTPSSHGAPGPASPTGQPRVYTFHVRGALGPDWVEWFEGAEILVQQDGTSRVVAEVRDQAMLFGLLIRIRDMGLPLLGLYPGRRKGRVT